MPIPHKIGQIRVRGTGSADPLVVSTWQGDSYFRLDACVPSGVRGDVVMIELLPYTGVMSSLWDFTYL